MNDLIPLSVDLGNAPGVQLQAMELVLPDDCSMDDWAAIGRQLCRSDQVLNWWLGDWARFGGGDRDQKGWRKHGRLKEFAESNGINYQTLRDMAWVSGKVELSRRRDNLEWSKHKEVAALPAADQDKWLGKAESDSLPVAELRRQIRQAGGERNALEADGPATRFASKGLDDLVHWLRNRPEGFWSEERKAVWKTRLEPVVRFWEAL